MISDHLGKTASIHLDYGADTAPFNVEDLHICPQGLRLRTCWYFAPGTELSVNFQLCDSASPQGSRLLKTEGVVVECRADEKGDGYHVTLVFLEITDDIRALIRDMAAGVVLPG